MKIPKWMYDIYYDGYIVGACIGDKYNKAFKSKEEAEQDAKEYGDFLSTEYGFSVDHFDVRCYRV